jgi:hypothetical protein
MKTCTRCGVEKPLTDFYPLKPGHGRRVNPGHSPECKTCNIARARAHQDRQRASDPEKYKADRARWARNRRLREYGITQADYDVLFEQQDGRCAICGRAESGAWGGLLPVDHDHKTGEVRGLLCHHCNGGLGQFGDDPDRLLAAAAYLLSRQDVLGEVTR